MNTAVPASQKWMLAVVAIAVPLSGIGALYPSNTWLQVGPVAVLLPLTIVALRRWPVSNAAAACMAGFVLLHLLAARWSYSFVPYDAWLSALGGDPASGTPGAERNMFDRLVHFSFGGLAVVPFVELAVRYGRLGRGQAVAGSLLFVLAVGGLYEVFEWGLTLALSPEAAGAYNGEQGDIFDSQKDMAIAALGALLAIPVGWRAGHQRGLLASLLDTRDTV